MTTSNLIQEREKTHGDWANGAMCADSLIAAMVNTPNWDTLNPSQRQALRCLALKMSRVLSGDPNHPDHWHDIAGYAVLGGADL